MNNILAISMNELLNFANSRASVILSLISSVVIWAVGHVFMTIALLVMAKNRGIKKGRWMAYFPFVNYLLLGKIVGEAVVWGKKIKNVGLWAMIFYAISVGMTFLLNMGSHIGKIQIIFNVKFNITNTFLLGWVTGSSIFYNIIWYTSFIWDIAYIFFEVSLIFLVFRLYRPQSALLYSLFAMFFNPPLFGILLFVVRNNERRSFKQYYYTPYNNPYNNQGNNYGGGSYGNPYQPQQPAKPQPQEDPFPEFSDNKGGELPSSDGDDLFN